MSVPFSDEVVALAESLEASGWQAFRRFAEDGRTWTDCPSCRGTLHHTGLFGIGLSYCRRCKIALGMGVHNTLAGGGMQKWPGVYYGSLYELVERDFFKMKELSLKP